MLNGDRVRPGQADVRHRVGYETGASLREGVVRHAGLVSSGAEKDGQEQTFDQPVFPQLTEPRLNDPNRRGLEQKLMQVTARYDAEPPDRGKDVLVAALEEEPTSR